MERRGGLGLTCSLECDECALRILYVYDRDTHEVLRNLRRVVSARGIETLVFLGPRDEGEGGRSERRSARTSLSSCSAVI